MSANAYNQLKPISNIEEKFENPIDITEIINICKQYSKLGFKIQHQIETIIEYGMEDSIKSGKVKVSSLPLIKYFLESIKDVHLLGDAALQADECIALIELFEMEHPELFVSPVN